MGERIRHVRLARTVAKYRYLVFGKRDTCTLPDKIIRGKINREIPSEFLKLVESPAGED